MTTLCAICETEIPDEDEFCNTCSEFIKWKHKKVSNERFGKFKKNKDYIEKWKSNRKEVVEE